MIENMETYLDNAATTPIYPEVADYMAEIQKTCYGNASSPHKAGVMALEVTDRATTTIADLIGCEKREVVFTSGGAESNSLALKGSALFRIKRGGGIVSTPYEHPTVLRNIDDICAKWDSGFTSRLCRIKAGVADMVHLADLVDEDTFLVSAMTVNSETGAYADMGEAAKEIKGKNPETIIHTDAVQAFCKYGTDMAANTSIDLMSLSSHKVRGPKGVGALFVRRGTRIAPITNGSGREPVIRAGTLNTAGIAGFAMAAERYAADAQKNIEKIRKLKKLAVNGLSDADKDVKIISPENSSPYILNAAFKGIRSEVLLNHLSGKGIYISSGSACSSKKKDASHVLKACGVSKEYIDGAVRISFCNESSAEDVGRLISEIGAILPILSKFRRK